MKPTMNLHFVLWLLISFSAHHLIEMKPTKAEIQVSQILSEIPEHERPDFLRYYLNHGHDLLAKAKDSSDYPVHKISDDKAILLYEYFASFHRITDEEKNLELLRIVCFPEGCFNTGDLGLYPK